MINHLRSHQQFKIRKSLSIRCVEKADVIKSEIISGLCIVLGSLCSLYQCLNVIHISYSHIILLKIQYSLHNSFQYSSNTYVYKSIRHITDQLYIQDRNLNITFFINILRLCIIILDIFSLTLYFSINYTSIVEVGNGKLEKVGNGKLESGILLHLVNVCRKTR